MRTVRRTPALAAASLLALASTGCFEIEQTIDLKKDMSGTAAVKIGIDFEPMIAIMAYLKRSMEGKEGAPSAEEIAAAKAEFKKSAQEKPPESKETVRKDFEGKLPEGIKLLDAKLEEREFGARTEFVFSFDKLSRLVDLKLPAKGGDDPTKKNVIDTPFEGLEVIEDGKTLTVRSKPQNPATAVKEDTKEGPPMDPATEKMMQDGFKNLSVGYRITAPFEIVSHNATRKEGNTLIWHYGLADFERIGKSKKPEEIGMNVVYRK